MSRQETEDDSIKKSIPLDLVTWTTYREKWENHGGKMRCHLNTAVFPHTAATLKETKILPATRFVITATEPRCRGQHYLIGGIIDWPRPRCSFLAARTPRRLSGLSLSVFLR